jgi:hypothetical protein
VPSETEKPCRALTGGAMHNPCMRDQGQIKYAPGTANLAACALPPHLLRLCPAQPLLYTRAPWLSSTLSRFLTSSSWPSKYSSHSARVFASSRPRSVPLSAVLKPRSSRRCLAAFQNSLSAAAMPCSDRGCKMPLSDTWQAAPASGQVPCHAHAIRLMAPCLPCESSRLSVLLRRVGGKTKGVYGSLRMAPVG